MNRPLELSTFADLDSPLDASAAWVAMSRPFGPADVEALAALLSPCDASAILADLDHGDGLQAGPLEVAAARMVLDVEADGLDLLAYGPAW